MTRSIWMKSINDEHRTMYAQLFTILDADRDIFIHITIVCVINNCQWLFFCKQILKAEIGLLFGVTKLLKEILITTTKKKHFQMKIKTISDSKSWICSIKLNGFSSLVLQFHKCWCYKSNRKVIVEFLLFVHVLNCLLWIHARFISYMQSENHAIFNLKCHLKWSSSSSSFSSLFYTIVFFFSSSFSSLSTSSPFYYYFSLYSAHFANSIDLYTMNIYPVDHAWNVFERTSCCKWSHDIVHNIYMCNKKQAQ